MLKAEELLSRETWTVVLSKLSIVDKLSCRCVCNSFKKEVDPILKMNQDRLWLSRCDDDDYSHYFCYDKDHRISSQDTLYFNKTISLKKLKFVSALMPSLKILQLDPLAQVYLDDHEYDDRDDWDEDYPDYRDKKGRVVPITKIFPQVACLILPGDTEKNNFVGNLSQVKHLTVLEDESTTFPNLDLLEVRQWCSVHGEGSFTLGSIPSKSLIVPHATIKWNTLPKTLEIIETELDCDEYISAGKPYFSNLKILKGLYEESNVENLMNFLKDHKGSLTELSLSVGKNIGNVKVLLPLLTRLQKLSVRIYTDEHVIELKEIKTLAYNLEYFELRYILRSATDKKFDPILENLPTGLDNLSIEDVRKYEEIEPFMEKIMEKVLNGDTKTVTIAKVNSKFSNAAIIINEILDISPSPVRVKKTNRRVFEFRYDSPGRRTGHFGTIRDIVISL